MTRRLGRTSFGHKYLNEPSTRIAPSLNTSGSLVGVLGMMVREIATGVLAGALALVVSSGTVSAQDERSLALVLDASGSMKARLADGTPRIEAAKSAVEQLIAVLPGASRLSFWAYGHQSPTQRKNCKDNELLAPLNAVASNKIDIGKSTRALQPQGHTPIAYSLTRAAEDLAFDGAAAHVVVLISDGRDTCMADPCAAARKLAEADARLVVHTVGVGADAIARTQLQCIANNARGSYFDADSAAALVKSLRLAAAKEPATAVLKKPIAGGRVGQLKLVSPGPFVLHRVVDAAGNSVADFARRMQLTLPAGIYGVTFPNGVWQSIEVKAGETTEVTPSVLEVSPRGAEFVRVLEPESGEVVGELPSNATRTTLMPGHFDVRFGNVLWPGGVDLEPGQTLTLRPGMIVGTARRPLAFEVKTLDGRPAGEGHTDVKPRVALPPGRYVMEFYNPARPDRKRRMPITLAEAQELPVAAD
jgi:hypothetical protein